MHNRLYGYSDTPLTVTLLPFPEGVTVSGHICIQNRMAKTASGYVAKW